MTPDETIEQQARREAEERYPTHYGQRESWAEHIATFEREAYAAALIAERSKPQPSVDEHVHALYRAVDGDYICSGCEMVFVPK